MKHYIVLVFIILSHLYSFSQKTPKKIKSNKLYTINNQLFLKDSTALNGYYKIKYTDFLNDWKTEITYFKNGFRFGNSKILRFNKLEEEGIYVDGVKHGIWKQYSYKYGTLETTTEYKNGLKNGKEFGKRISSGYFICNYVDDVIDGPLLKYDFRGYLESKEYYEKGEKIYKHKYDDLLNIIEETYFTKNKGISISEEKRQINNDIYIDSLYYNRDTELAKSSYSIKKTPFKIKSYKNSTLLVQKEISIHKDTTRVGKKNKVLTFNYDNYIHNKHTSISVYYDEYYSISEIKKALLTNYALNYNFCSSDLFFFWATFKNLYLYVNYRKNGNTHEIHYAERDKKTPVACNKKIMKEGDNFKQTY